ncbi:hypothetical protein, partial [Aetokthonos hydrillicola]
GLSALVLSSVSISSARAEQAAYNPAVSNTTSAYEARVSPVKLVLLAYKGEFKSSGIPGYQQFQYALINRQVTAQDLVRGAVNSRLLPPQALTDKQLLKDVDSQLFNFAYNL